MIVGTWVWDAAGHRQVEDWQAALSTCQRGGEGFVWIGMDEPDPEELQLLAKQLSLHPLAVEDALKGGQRPKVDRYEDSLLVSLRPLEYDDAHSDVETRELTVFVGPCYVVSVRRGGHTPLKAVRYGLDQAPPPLRATPVGALHGLLDAVVDHYGAIADDLAEDLDDMEQQVFAGARGTDAADIYRLKREVREARRAMQPLLDPVADMAHGANPVVPEGARPFFADVLDHLVRTAERVEAVERSLTDVLNVHLTQVSVQQNDDSRKISAWAAIAVAPTLIAGIYGMNFQFIPETQWHWGYFYALALMVAVCVGLYAGFKRSGWL